MTDAFTTTADDVLAGHDLTGSTIVITGATGGLGLGAALAFARASADVVLVGRDRAKLDRAVAAVDGAGSGRSTGELADISDLDSVAGLVDRIRADHSRIDVLVLNAGVMAAPLERSAQGHEMQLAVSYLGHAALTQGLIELVVAAGGRVVSLTSSGHWLGGYDASDPDFRDREYDKWAAYGQAKTASALLAIALAERFGGDGVVAAAVHPGVIRTDLQRHLGEDEESHILAMSEEQGELRSVEAGAASIVWAAVATEVADANGCFVADAAVANELRAPHASGVEDALALWDRTVELIAAESA